MRPDPALRRVAVAVLLAVLALLPTPAIAGPGYEPQIVGGEEAAPGAYPWAVGLLDADVEDPLLAQFCGGSLVAARWVLTAAHCVEGLGTGDVDVLTATHVLEKGAGQRIAVARILRHPQAVPTGSGTGAPWLYDAALLELTAAATPAPVDVATTATWRSWVPGTTATVVGWGSVTTAQDASFRDRYPTALRALDVPILPDYGCSFAERHGAATVLCAGGPETGICDGDSGGPLVAPHDGAWLQVGIVSAGRSPCGDGSADVFTEVAAIAPWVQATTGLDLRASRLLRLSADDAYASSVAISQHTFPPDQTFVHIATAADYADGLVGGVIAAEQGPLLLVPSDHLPGIVRTELARLRPDYIMIFGGPGAVSEEVEQALAEYGATVRLAGIDRYATAAAIVEWRYAGGEQPSHVFIATGENYPDALAAVPLARGLGPILLTRSETLPEVTIERLRALAPANIVVLGGTSAVSETVVEALRDLAPNVRRIAGAHRYATAAAIATDAEAWTRPDFLYVTSGQDFRLALPGGVAAAVNRSPLLLVPPTALPQEVAAAAGSLPAERVVVLGGQEAVSSPVAAELVAVVGP